MRRSSILWPAVLTIWFIVVGFPLYWMAITAFKEGKDVFPLPTFLPWIDFQPTLSAFEQIFAQFPDFTWETYRVLYGEDHWILDWALISGDIRFDCLDVVDVSPDGMVARKDTFIDTVQLQAAMGTVPQ